MSLSDHVGNPDRELERARVLAILDGTDRLAACAHAPCQVFLCHLVVLEAQLSYRCWTTA